MNCPYEKELKEGTMVCDSGYSHCSLPECPTETFNKCQSEAYEESLKQINEKI